MTSVATTTGLEEDQRHVDASEALYIKLGDAGLWEEGCIKGGTMRLGYQELSHDLCSRGRWDEVANEVSLFSKDEGAIKRHVKQVRYFYEAPPSTLWITFYSDRLWWCFADSEVI